MSVIMLVLEVVNPFFIFSVEFENWFKPWIRHKLCSKMLEYYFNLLYITRKKNTCLPGDLGENWKKQNPKWCTKLGCSRAYDACLSLELHHINWINLTANMCKYCLLTLYRHSSSARWKTLLFDIARSAAVSESPLWVGGADRPPCWGNTFGTWPFPRRCPPG